MQAHLIIPAGHAPAVRIDRAPCAAICIDDARLVFEDDKHLDAVLERLWRYVEREKQGATARELVAAGDALGAVEVVGENN